MEQRLHIRLKPSQCGGLKISRIRISLLAALFLCVFSRPLFSATNEFLSVQVKQGQLRSTPSFLGSVTAILNEYLTAMTDIIQEEGGTVDKYEGDAIIAFWNAPLQQADHAGHSVRAAMRCQAKLAEMRPSIRERIGRDLRMRIGINSGPAVVGNLGSHTRFDYTMLGDAVNLAARLEGINKQFGTYTIVSEATLERMEEAFPVRELSRVAVVGRKDPVRIYEPIFPEEFAVREKELALFAEGLAAFYSGQFAAAEGIFTGLKDRDPVAAAYAGKCRSLLDHPPEDWGGVWVVTSK